jgi:hypothetical protein
MMFGGGLWTGAAAEAEAEAVAVADPSGCTLLTVLETASLFELVVLLILGEPLDSLENPGMM